MACGITQASYVARPLPTLTQAHHTSKLDVQGVLKNILEIKFAVVSASGYSTSLCIPFTQAQLSFQFATLIN